MSNEEKWLRAVADGRREAMEALFEAFKPKIFRYVLSLLRNYHGGGGRDAGRLFKDFPVCRSIYGGLLRRYLDVCHRPPRGSGLAAPERHGGAVYGAALSGTGRRPRRIPVLSSCCRLLDKRSRDVVALHLAGGLKYREIAALTGETESAVRQRYSRALKHLKQILKGG